MNCDWQSWKRSYKDAVGGHMVRYCQSLLWLWILFWIGCFLFLVGLALCLWMCLKGKKKVKKVKENPYVELPERQEVVVEHRPAPVVRESRVLNEDVRVTEHRTYEGVGDRVLVEKRTYSPDRSEPYVERFGGQDWGKYSQANWNSGSRVLYRDEHTTNPYNPYNSNYN